MAKIAYIFSSKILTNSGRFKYMIYFVDILDAKVCSKGILNIFE